MIWVILVCLAAAQDASQESSNFDLESQLEKRSLWFTCLSVVRSAYERDSETIQKVAQENNLPEDRLQHKVMADILLKCSNSLSNQKVEEILNTENLDLEDSEVKEASQVDLQSFSNEEDLELTEEQLKLLDDINWELKKAQQFVQANDELQNQIGILPAPVYYGSLVFGIVFLFGLFFLGIKLLNQKPKKKKK